MSNDAKRRFDSNYEMATSLIPSTAVVRGRAVAANKARMAIVCSVAAMDAYFTQKFMNHLTPFIQKNGLTDGLREIMEKARVGPDLYVRIMDKKRPFRVIHSTIKSHLSSKWTTQRFDKIDELFAAFHMSNLSEGAIKVANANVPRTGGLDIKNRIEELVKRRNQIAHACDMDSRRNYRKIDTEVLRRDCDLLNRFVTAAHDNINKRMSGSGARQGAAESKPLKK